MPDEKTEKAEKAEKLPTTLPDTQGEFDIEVRGDITNRKYLGTFSCKLLTRRDHAQIARHKARLNGPDVAQLNLAILTLHHRVSYLRYALIEPYPKFWTRSDFGYDLYDGNIIDEIFTEVARWEEAWMREVWGNEEVDSMIAAGKERKPE